MVDLSVVVSCIGLLSIVVIVVVSNNDNEFLSLPNNLIPVILKTH